MFQSFKNLGFPRWTQCTNFKIGAKVQYFFELCKKKRKTQNGKHKTSLKIAE